MRDRVEVQGMIKTDGVVEWDVNAKIEWYPGEEQLYKHLSAEAQETVRWAKWLRKPVDGRCFKVVGGGKSYGFVRVKDRFESRIERDEQE